MTASRRTLVLKVTRKDGTPVLDARAALISGPAHADLAALTNAQGLATFAGLAPGTYTVAILAQGRQRQVSVRVPTTSLPVEVAFEF